MSTESNRMQRVKDGFLVSSRKLRPALRATLDEFFIELLERGRITDAIRTIQKEYPDYQMANHGGPETIRIGLRDYRLQGRSSTRVKDTVETTYWLSLKKV